MTPNELVLPFGGSYVCANFGENRSRNVTVRVLAQGQTHRQHRQTDANRFYNLSHAICYSYGADYNNILHLPLFLLATMSDVSDDMLQHVINYTAYIFFLLDFHVMTASRLDWK